MADAPVWVLLGQRTGDNNQLLRLAGELKVPFRPIQLHYNPLHLVPPGLLGPSLASLTRRSRRQIRPPWPSLVLGIGYRSVPVALAIRRLSGGSARLVRLGNPRLDPSSFDLVITTPQYSVPDRPNVLRLPLGISTASHLEPTREESKWLAKFPRPHRLLLIGGDTFMWSVRGDKVASAAEALAAKKGSVIAVSSGRSSPAVLDAVATAFQGSEHALVRGRFPRYALLLQDADEIFVTADSVAMLSDAIATGKPVGLVEPDRNLAGRFFYGLESSGFAPPVRDIRRFWRAMLDRGLAGTLADPKSGKISVDSLAQAVEAVRSLLET